MTSPRTNASHDQNRVPTLIGVSTADGVTPVPVEVNPVSGGMITDSLIPFAYDYVGMSNADGNGNYQTVVYKNGGSSGLTVATLTMTFDGSSNVTSITRS